MLSLVWIALALKFWPEPALKGYPDDLGQRIGIYLNSHALGAAEAHETRDVDGVLLRALNALNPDVAHLAALSDLDLHMCLLLRSGHLRPRKSDRPQAPGASRTSNRWRSML
jgi:hypothetical protein